MKHIEYLREYLEDKEIIAATGWPKNSAEEDLPYDQYLRVMLLSNTIKALPQYYNKASVQNWFKHGKKDLRGNSPMQLLMRQEPLNEGPYKVYCLAKYPPCLK